ncbi:MAG: SAM-dependent methyltransferase, partial [Beijerinckiaceae bacterium]
SARFSGQATIRVVDLGCGAGSNLRGTFAALGREQRWTLVDYDRGLLDAARGRLSTWADDCRPDGKGLDLQKDGRRIAVGFREADLSRGAFGDVIAGADLVTAAALFDLASIATIEQLADAVTRNNQAFYTVLTYDGHTRWTPAHPSDDAIRAAFNAHQKTDKGFGAAAGPGGTTALARAFYARGYRVIRGTSPWVVDARYGALRDELDKGFSAAAVDSGMVDRATANGWLGRRLGLPDAVSVIGHEDLLALPA